MKLAILCKDCGDVDIIDNVPEMTNDEDIEEYLSCELNYNPQNIRFMALSGSVNYLTPEDFA